jgi:hypothetical protein
MPGPTKAPNAPANFQSPAPRLRRSTNGSSKASPTAAPSSEARSPAHRPKTVFAVTPINSPGTVSQFGMRRLRRSVHPAMSDKSTAPARINGFKRAPTRGGRRLELPRFHHDIEFDCENNAFCAGSEFAGAEASCCHLRHFRPQNRSLAPDSHTEGRGSQRKQITVLGLRC